MADEKLPELPKHVHDAITDFWNQLVEWCEGKADDATRELMEDDKSPAEAALRIAIHRFAREREAAALERAAQVCDGWREIAGTLDNSALTTGAMAVVAKAIRALIPKEPANG